MSILSQSTSFSKPLLLRNLLIDLGLGTTPSDDGAWPIYVARTPNAPDSVITVTNTTPRTQGRTSPNGITIHHYGVQIKVRDAGPTDGWVKANALTVALDQTVLLSVVTLEDTDGTGSSTYMVYAISHSGILSLGKETPTSKRDLFSINALVALRQTA